MGEIEDALTAGEDDARTSEQRRHAIAAYFDSQLPKFDALILEFLDLMAKRGNKPAPAKEWSNASKTGVLYQPYGAPPTKPTVRIERFYEPEGWHIGGLIITQDGNYLANQSTSTTRVVKSRFGRFQHNEITTENRFVEVAFTPVLDKIPPYRGTIQGAGAFRKFYLTGPEYLSGDIGPGEFLIEIVEEGPEMYCDYKSNVSLTKYLADLVRRSR